MLCLEISEKSNGGHEIALTCSHPGLQDSKNLKIQQGNPPLEDRVSRPYEVWLDSEERTSIIYWYLLGDETTVRIKFERPLTEEDSVQFSVL